jgi:pimeloyl-ACP methyl ester carboxylesterase
MSWPNLHHPAVIIHGTQDDIVPIESSRKVSTSNPTVELIEVEDGHRLAESMHFIPLAVQRVMTL